ncbi:SDR family NAD(P)-dependent oxidoreductase [Roseomonas chloroacetimidivorans]|uniref:SDR family NAD(P)-dependent oxidoreductase n=1 Tax=Roseomonas chloroacetimidivorans TaxID=1766656 RepID=UPI003C7096A9
MSEQGLLAGKVVLVTGAGRGIGRDLALAAAGAGAKVVVNDLGAGLDGRPMEDDPAAAVVAEIRAAGGEAVTDGHSVAEPEGAEAMVAAAVSAFGRIDGVVNNAGILRDKMIWKMDHAEWDAVMKVHLYGSFNVSRAAALRFREQGSGAFVHITSTAGLVGNVGQANYAAAKLGIVGLSRSIALEMGRFGVRSNTLAPFALTRMVTSIPGADSEAFLAKRREMTAAKIGPLTVFLLSDAAAEVSGQVFAVRGNELMIMSQPRPVRSVHRSDGWTPETVQEAVLGTLRPNLTPLEGTMEVFSGPVI